VLKDVPRNATVTGMRARIIKIDGKRINECSSHINPEELLGRIFRLEEELYLLKRELNKIKGEEEKPSASSDIEVEVEVRHKK